MKHALWEGGDQVCLCDSKSGRINKISLQSTVESGFRALRCSGGTVPICALLSPVWGQWFCHMGVVRKHYRGEGEQTSAHGRLCLLGMRAGCPSTCIRWWVEAWGREICAGIFHPSQTLWTCPAVHFSICNERMSICPPVLGPSIFFKLSSALAEHLHNTLLRASVLCGTLSHHGNRKCSFAP